MMVHTTDDACDGECRCIKDKRVCLRPVKKMPHNNNNNNNNNNSDKKIIIQIEAAGIMYRFKTKISGQYIVMRMNVKTYEALEFLLWLFDSINSRNRGASASCQHACAPESSWHEPRAYHPPCGRTCSCVVLEGGEADRRQNLHCQTHRLNKSLQVWND